VLKSGGYLVTVTKSTRAGGALRDLAGQTVASAWVPSRGVHRAVWSLLVASLVAAGLSRTSLSALALLSSSSSAWSWLSRRGKDAALG